MNANAYYQQPFPYAPNAQQYTQAPSQSPYHPSNQPTAQLTPYQLYMKPVQPIDLLQPQAGVSMNQQHGSSHGHGIMGLFTDTNGQMDFDKMLSSIGQIAGTYHQVSPIVKQLGSLVKMFRT